MIITSCNLPKNSGQQSVQEPTKIVIVNTPVGKGEQIPNGLFEVSINKVLIIRVADNASLDVNIDTREQEEYISFILSGSIKRFRPW